MAKVSVIHFNGGTITWVAIDSYANLSSINIIISQTYAWTHSIINCTTDVPLSVATVIKV